VAPGSKRKTDAEHNDLRPNTASKGKEDITPRSSYVRYVNVNQSFQGKKEVSDNLRKATVGDLLAMKQQKPEQQSARHVR
jgi:hypothetical protein